MDMLEVAQEDGNGQEYLVPRLFAALAEDLLLQLLDHFSLIFLYGKEQGNVEFMVDRERKKYILFSVIGCVAELPKLIKVYG